MPAEAVLDNPMLTSGAAQRVGAAAGQSAREPLIEVTIDAAEHLPHLAWAQGLRVSLPARLLTETDLLGGLRSDGTLVMPARRPEVSPAEAEALRLRAAFTEHPPLASRLPISYRRLPAWARSLLASAIGRWKRHAMRRGSTFPRYPIDLSADFLADLARARPSPLAHGPTPVVLTHDIDSPQGMRNLIRWFLDLEESVGARSTCYVVPNGWPIDHGALQQVRERGHEIGVHGHDHSNRTPFLYPPELRRRLSQAADLIERYAAVGYRAPSLYRTRNLLRGLADLYQYDSSIPTSGGPFPVPNNGCASARPFVVEGITELPLTMPRDGSLRFMGYSPREILNLWIRCAQTISRSGGVVVLLTHCESWFSGNAPMYASYRKFLEFVAQSKSFAFQSTAQVLARISGAARPMDKVTTDQTSADRLELAAV